MQCCSFLLLPSQVRWSSRWQNGGQWPVLQRGCCYCRLFWRNAWKDLRFHGAQSTPKDGAKYIAIQDGVTRKHSIRRNNSHVKSHAQLSFHLLFCHPRFRHPQKWGSTVHENKARASGDEKTEEVGKSQITPCLIVLCDISLIQFILLVHSWLNHFWRSCGKSSRRRRERRKKLSWTECARSWKIWHQLNHTVLSWSPLRSSV